MYPLLRASNFAERGAHARRVPSHSLLLPVDSNLKRQRYTLIFNPRAHLRNWLWSEDLSRDSSAVIFPRISSRVTESSLLVICFVICKSVSVPGVGYRLREAEVTTECAMRRMHPAHTRDPHESQGYALARWCKSLSPTIPVNRALTGTLRDLADPGRLENSNLAIRVTRDRRVVFFLDKFTIRVSIHRDYIAIEIIELYKHTLVERERKRMERESLGILFIPFPFLKHLKSLIQSLRRKFHIKT